jgi:hypothetical protein
MSAGLLALLDDIAAIAKVAAASVDDVAAQAMKASSKAAGVVIDDAAVTPKYVVGLTPDRELPIILNIAKGSLKNKLVFLLPAALFLGFAAPWAIAPLLALGGLFLCFEGYEKLLHVLRPHTAHTDSAPLQAITPEELERMRTDGAIRTDFILSAEIMAISYATVVDAPLVTQAITLLVVAIGITVAVYGFVALVVKADDVGLHLAQEKHRSGTQALGKAIVHFMPPFLKVLGYVGMAAMLWVGGGILLHSVPSAHHAVVHMVQDTLGLHGALAWLAEATISGVVGVIAGAVVERLWHVVAPIVTRLKKIMKNILILVHMVWLFALQLLFAVQPAFAKLELEITRCSFPPIAIAIPDFASVSGELGTVGRNIAGVVAADLERSGLFRIVDKAAHIEQIGYNTLTPRFADWRQINADGLVVGKVDSVGAGKMKVSFRLYDNAAEVQAAGKQFDATEKNWRRIAHLIADEIYKHIMGEK